MQPRIEILKPKKLIGIHMEMSLANNKTAELWQKFMPRRAEVKNRLTTDYISMQKYSESVPKTASNTISRYRFLNSKNEVPTIREGITNTADILLAIASPVATPMPTEYNPAINPLVLLERRRKRYTANQEKKAK